MTNTPSYLIVVAQSTLPRLQVPSQPGRLALCRQTA